MYYFQIFLVLSNLMGKLEAVNEQLVKITKRQNETEEILKEIIKWKNPIDEKWTGIMKRQNETEEKLGEKIKWINETTEKLAAGVSDQCQLP